MSELCDTVSNYYIYFKNIIEACQPRKALSKGYNLNVGSEDQFDFKRGFLKNYGRYS